MKSWHLFDGFQWGACLCLSKHLFCPMLAEIWLVDKLSCWKVNTWRKGKYDSRVSPRVLGKTGPTDQRNNVICETLLHKMIVILPGSKGISSQFSSTFLSSFQIVPYFCHGSKWSKCSQKDILISIPITTKKVGLPHGWLKMMGGNFMQRGEIFYHLHHEWEVRDN